MPVPALSSKQLLTIVVALGVTALVSTYYKPLKKQFRTPA
jgi:hypothetical protein